MTVADLIRQHVCTAACVAAVTATRRCTCPCDGQFHGLLASAEITAILDARRRGLHHLTDAEIVASTSLENQ